MKIPGIGNVTKSEILSVLTTDGKKALKDGTLTIDEAAGMYKLALVKRASRIGSINDTFSACYDRIPAGIVDALAPEQIAALVDSYYVCYGDGIAEGKRRT